MKLSVPFATGLGGEPVALAVCAHRRVARVGEVVGPAVIVAGLAMRTDVAIVAVDLKRVELAAWRPRLSALALEPDEATTVLQRVVNLVDARYAYLEARGVTRWVGSMAMPNVVVVVDELAEVVDTGEPSDKIRERLPRRILSKGRAAGVTVVSATQRPSAHVLATSVRDLYQLRVAHADHAQLNFPSSARRVPAVVATRTRTAG